ncbi:MAG: hypothetical protein ABIS20_10425 [Thermoanaerobaculia bacterium]
MSFGDGFLRFPDLFPGRRGGEPWGDRTVAVDVAGGPYLFTGLSAAQAAAVRDRFAGLCRDASEAAATAMVATQVFRAPAADFLDRDVRGWEYTLDMEHAPSAVSLAGLRLMARLDWGPHLAGGLWTCEEAGEEWSASVFENFLRVLAAYRLLAEEGAVIHSAGVTGGESAFLLLGPSGAGKTTVSRLCLARGAAVLSDDLNAVRLGDGGARLQKLPFTGDLGDRGSLGDAPASVPLRALLRLAKGPEERLRPLSPAAALAGLVAAAPFVNRDPWRREALLGVLERLARAVPAYELTFSLAGDPWAILQSISP